MSSETKMSSEMTKSSEMTMSPEMNRTGNDISPEALAHLGDGRIAYVKAVRSCLLYTSRCV